MESPQYRRTEKISAYALIALGVGLMIHVAGKLLTKDSFVASWDSEFYTLQGVYWVKNLLPLGRVAGWFPIWLGGFDYYIMYPPLSSFITGLMSLVFGWIMTTRLFSIGLWIGIVFVSYSFLRSLGIPRLVAATGATMMVALNVALSLGFSPIFLIGFLPQALGFLFSVIVLGCTYRLVTSDEFLLRKSVKSGGYLGLLVIAHHFCTLWWGIASLIMLACFTVKSPFWMNKLKNYAVMMAVGLTLSAFWWVPLLLNRGMMVNVPPVFEQLTADMPFVHWYRYLSPLLLALALVGAGYLWMSGQRRLFSFLVLILIYSLVQSMGWIPFPLEVVNGIQSRRLQGYIDWTILVFTAFGFLAIQRYYEKNLVRGWGTLLPVLLFGIFVQFQMRGGTFNRDRHFHFLTNNAPTDEIYPLSEFLRGKLKPGEIHFSESHGDERTYGGWHFLNVHLPRMVPGLWDLSGGYPEAIRGAERPFYFSRRMASEIGTGEAYLRSRGVRYVSTMQLPTRKLIEKKIPWLQKVWQGQELSGNDELASFELKDFNTPFGLRPEVAKNLQTFSYAPPGRYTLEFSSPVVLTAGSTFAVNYHPWFQITADGRPVAKTHNSDWLLAVAEDVKGVKSVVLTYTDPVMVTGVRFLSLLGWLTFLFYLVAGALGFPRDARH